MSAILLVSFVLGIAVGVLVVGGLIHILSVLITRSRSGWYNGKI